MTRSILDFPLEEPKITECNPEYNTKTYTIQVITPIFGGGVVPGENDLGIFLVPGGLEKFDGRLKAGQLETRRAGLGPQFLRDAATIIGERVVESLECAGRSGEGTGGGQLPVRIVFRKDPAIIGRTGGT